MTGLMPHQHGLHVNTMRLPDDVVTLAEVLASAGWDTAAAVGAAVLDRRSGLQQGFLTFLDGPFDKSAGTLGYRETSARAVTESATAYLRQRQQHRPLFLWVHYFDPHAIYRPLRTPPRRPKFPRSTPPPVDYEPHEIANLKSRYLDEIHRVDDAIGDLLQVWSELGYADDSWVVVTSDHGESLGEHGEWTHTFFAYDSTTHVPLILAPPAGLARQSKQWRPQIIDRLVSLAWLAPSVARWLHLRWQEGAGDLISASAAVQMVSHAPRYDYGWPSFRAVTDGRFKLVDAGEELLFDLASDPGETTDISASHPDLLSKLRALLPPSVEPADSVLPELRTMEEMAALGYVAGGVMAMTRRPLAKLVSVHHRFLYARTLLFAGWWEKARKELESLMSAYPEIPTIRLEYVHCLSKLGRADEALSQLARVDGVLPVLIDQTAFRLFLNQNRLHQAEETLQRLRGSLPPAEFDRCSADLAYGNGDYERAAAIYRKLAESREDPDLLVALYLALQRDGARAEARPILDRAVQLGHPRALLIHGADLRAAGRLKAAEAVYERLLTLSPHSVAGWNNWASVQLERGKPRLALRVLEPLLARDEAGREVVQNFAQAMCLGGMRAEAEKLLSRAGLQPVGACQ